MNSYLALQVSATIDGKISQECEGETFSLGGHVNMYFSTFECHRLLKYKKEEEILPQHLLDFNSTIACSLPHSH